MEIVLSLEFNYHDAITNGLKLWNADEDKNMHNGNRYEIDFLIGNRFRNRIYSRYRNRSCNRTFNRFCNRIFNRFCNRMCNRFSIRIFNRICNRGFVIEFVIDLAVEFSIKFCQVSLQSIEFVSFQSIY